LLKFLGFPTNSLSFYNSVAPPFSVVLASFETPLMS